MRLSAGQDTHDAKLMFPDEKGQIRRAKFALFPDEYDYQQVLGPKGFDYPCPVRTCPLYATNSVFETLDELDKHFEAILPFLLYL